MREIQFRAKPCYTGVRTKSWVYGTFEYIPQRIVSALNGLINLEE